MDLDVIFANGRFLALLRLIARSPLFTGAIMKYVEKRAYEAIVINNRENRPMRVRQDQYALILALLKCFVRSYKKGYISKNVADSLLGSFVTNVVLGARRTVENGATVDHPFTIAISPTQSCNLRCIGCYAASDAKCEASLDFDVFDRLVTEKAALWNSKFTVISGGEPFLYKSGDKGMLDIVERHKDQMFLVYTNGTLITKETAARMAQAGNITPAISLEGFEKETDARRGKGIYKRIMASMANLREAGVPFGISATAARNNWEVVVARDFVEHMIIEQGAVYMWIFQYMPIGRAQSLDLMVTPEARKEMLARTWDYVRKDGYFVADFWNSGTGTNGCISAGRPGGYFYVNWHGDIMPCVFTPYSTDNIYDIYNKGGDINTVLDTPFFRNIRQWQDSYGFRHNMDKPDNWLAPCIIRDHLQDFLQAAVKAGARPADESAAVAVKDNAYVKGLACYGRDYYSLTAPVWRDGYLPPVAQSTPAAPAAPVAPAAQASAPARSGD